MCALSSQVKNMNSSAVSVYGNSSLPLLNAIPRDSFSAALTKNIVAMLVWLALSILNCSMVSTFSKHSFFYEDPRYIMFICMVINDAVQLTLVTALYVVSIEIKYGARNDLKDTRNAVQYDWIQISNL